jgi:AcrR family transcriptional regulator
MGVPTEVSLRGRPRDPQRREAILRAAVTLIAEVGYDRMTVEALAARAGVSKPTIYRRWPGGKPEIVADAIRNKHGDLEQLPDTGSLRGDLLAMFEGMIIETDEDRRLAAGMISQLRSSPELAALIRDEHISHERRRYDTVIGRAVQRGELSPELRVTPLLSDVAGSMIFTRAVISGEPLDREFLTELVDHVILPILQKA